MSRSAFPLPRNLIGGPLSRDEQARLSRVIATAERNSPEWNDARNRLAMSVVLIAWERSCVYCQTKRRRLNYHDAFSAAVSGTIDAASRFDASKGIGFADYAKSWILKSTIDDELFARSVVTMPNWSRTGVKHDPLLDLKRKEFDEFNEPTTKQDDASQPETTRHQEVVESLLRAANLSENERSAVLLAHGFEGEMGQREIGDKIGMRQQTVSKCVQRGLKKLRVASERITACPNPSTTKCTETHSPNIPPVPPAIS